MTDRELLEAAANAAGIRLIGWDNGAAYVGSEGCHGGIRWNPLTDDGDALRLAVKMRTKSVKIEIGVGGVCVDMRTVNADEFTPTDGGDFDPYAATRRAIVRAAAAMSTSQRAAPLTEPKQAPPGESGCSA